MLRFSLLRRRILAYSNYAHLLVSRCPIRLTTAFFAAVFAFVGPAFSQILTFGRTDISTGTGPQGVAVADFNRDGIADIAVLNSGSGTMSILLGNGDGTFKPQLVTTLGTTSEVFAVGDFNGDGIPDVIANNVGVLLGKGDGTFQPAISFPLAFDGIAVGDFNGDGKQDIAMAMFPEGTVNVALGKGDGTFQAAAEYTVGRGLGSGTIRVAASDLNRDGKLDIVAVNSDSNNISVLLGNGDGTFADAVNYATIGIVPICLAIADVNGDGKPDVVVGDDSGVEVFIGKGDGSFQAPSSIGLPPYIQSIAIADVNGDGKPDIVCAREQATASTSFVLVLPGNGDGTFGVPSGFAVGEVPLSLAVSAFTRDNKMDIVTANQAGDGISVLLNSVSVPSPAAAVSVTPSSGSGVSPTFTFEYSDVAGATNLTQVWVQFGSATSNSCLLYYDRASNSIFLQNDAGTGWLADNLGNIGSSALYNSQCSFNTDDTTVSLIGTSLTLYLPISFSESFGGSKIISMMAVAAGGYSSGWQARGTWIVPSNLIVTNDSVSPTSGAGGTQQFVVQYTDTSGVQNLQGVWLYFNASLANPDSNSCMVSYDIATLQVGLLNDAGTAWMTERLGEGGPLQNSQCALSETWVDPGGTTLTVGFTLSFQPSFNGVQNIYMNATDISGISSGWQQMGTWTTPSSITVDAISVAPSSGFGTSQPFTLQYSDSTGAAYLQSMWVLFDTTLSTSPANSCMLYYGRSTNQMYLLNDAGTGWLTAPVVNGTTLQNSQCSLDFTNYALASITNGLALNLPITFQPAYAGTKNVYMYGVDSRGATSGWVQRGTWTVPSVSGPIAVGMTPSSGSAAIQTFALEYSDTAETVFQSMWVYFGAAMANPAINACELNYNVSTNQISLLSDNGTTWQSAAPGSPTTLQNSQCSLNAAASAVNLSGRNTTTLILAMTFNAAYAGTQNVYLYADDALGSNSGWQQVGLWTVPGPPSTPATISVTPNSGSGAIQTFALQYSDTGGAANLQQLWAYFDASLANPASNACMLYYNTETNQINLLNDNGTGWTPATLGSATTLQNSQCSLNVATATASSNGNTRTLNVTVTFKPAFVGAKNVYLHSVDQSGTSGWQQLGTWTVTSSAGTPSTVSVTPNSGSGASQTFALQYSDTAGAASLQQVWAYFNATLANPASNACMLYYNAATNQINLLNDTAGSWISATLGAAATLQNSQCSLNVGTASVSSSGSALTLNVTLTFKPAFAGAKNVYLHAIDLSGSNSGWQQLGSWVVTSSAGTPSTVSVTPSSGSGASQTFALQYSDTSGAASLEQVWAYFNATLANPAGNSCMLYYNVATGQINLLDDSGSSWMAATLGAATTLQNSQCSLNVGTATVSSSGNTLTLNVTVTFKPAFVGAKNAYLHAVDGSGSNSGWQQLGTWTVASSAGTPSTVSVTPNSGSAASQTFALQYSDTAGAASLEQVWAYFNATLANPAGNACVLYYNTATNQINLLNDDATLWMSATLGSSTTLQNSQCSLNVGTATVSSSGSTLTLNVTVTFKPAFAGAKNVYLHALDVSGTNSGWQQLGTWTVTVITGTPAAVSVTPSSGQGGNPLFALQYTDTTGAANLEQVWVYVNATLANPASGACMLYYSPASNQINLLSDNAMAWQSATLGTAIVLQNSQCLVNAATTTAELNGFTLTLNLTMLFQPAFQGTKNVYLRALDTSGTNGGWQQLGAWTVISDANAPAALSVTPASGSGTSRTFTLQYYDSSGAANLQTAWVYFNATLANPASNACLLYYNVASNQINLLNDSGTAWQAATPGTLVTLQNTQCSLNAATATVEVNGSILTWNLPMTFTPAFAGAQTIYMHALDAELVSLWQQYGTWTVL